MSEPPIRVFDMETRIADDHDGSYVRSLREELGTELREVKQQMNSGLPPEQFKQATEYATALESASAVLEKMWKAERSSRPN